MSQKTWGGRFSGDTDDRVEAFTESISFDRRLYRHDIVASQAHARMLAEVGLLTADEAEQIVAALDDIAAEIERGEFAFSIKLEDIHTHIERALIERLGDVGRKLHTGRSRNDQVVTDVKLWVRDAIDELDEPLARAASAPCSTPPSATATSCCPATRTCSGRSRCWRRTTSWPTSRSTSATATAWPTAASASTSCRSAPPPWPARRCRSTATACAGNSASTRVAANSLDVSSDRDFAARIRLRPVAHRPAPERLGRGVGAVDDDGVRLPRPAGCVLHRVEHHAAQEEPGRAGTDPRQVGAGGRRICSSCSCW